MNLKLLTAFTAAMIGFAGTASAQEVTLKLGHVLSPTHQFHKGMELAAEKLAESTNGKVKLEVFPSSQLGTERDMHVSIRTGGVDMLLASPGGASVHLPELAVLDAPYLFKNDAHWQAVVYGDIGADWESKITEATGAHIMGWFPRGTRHVITKGIALNTIDDIRNVKIRVADIPPYPQVFQAFGATPTPVAFSEMYSALQAGVVDGADVPLDTILAQKLHEVSDHVNLIAWSFAAPGPILLSDDAYNRLSEEDRAHLREALRAGTEYIAKAFSDSEDSVTDALKEKGMTFVTPTDLDAWRAAAADAVPELAELWGGDAELYTRISDVAK
ncbi:MAG: TRAP transporter substrate-binding protein [Rhizobiaceae bacterium]|nr:TRAP transporter substrate-binding protein [Rhizobiaceae bacterium]